MVMVSPGLISDSVMLITGEVAPSGVVTVTSLVIARPDAATGATTHTITRVNTSYRELNNRFLMIYTIYFPLFSTCSHTLDTFVTASAQA